MDAAKPEISAPDAKSPLTALIPRDVSWLQFNARVLEEAEDPRNPLLERVKFLAISSTNLDEFHMVRIASNERSIASLQRKHEENAVAQLVTERKVIYDELRRFMRRQRKALNQLALELRVDHVYVETDPRQPHYRAIAQQLFEIDVLPKLPQPESYNPERLLELGNLEMAALCPGNLWMRLPSTLPSVLSTFERGSEQKIHFFFLDHLLQTFLWPATRDLCDVGLVRVTRGADASINLTNSDPDFIPDTVLSGIKTRDKDSPVRLQVLGNLSSGTLERMRVVLKLREEQIFTEPPTLVLNGLWEVFKKTPNDVSAKKPLRYAVFSPMIPKPFRQPAELFSHIGERDFLLHHPYDSFDAYVALIRAAAKDPAVERIEQTVYRMDAISPVTTLLKEAAARKEVRVVVELRARFDELNNLRLADELRKAGVKVYFGFGNLKLHAKVALLTRREGGVLRTYAHLSTGNYNAATARQYTDLGLITADPEIGADVRYFFDCMYAREMPKSFKQLVIAPQFLARRMVSGIREETEAARKGRPARIFAKVNALVEPKIIEALYEASQAGVHIDLLVRGACSLIPGRKGLSENIRVISIVDRYLEHSRIYYFEQSHKLYLSSADWMPRNFFSRFEIAFPVLQKNCYAYIVDVLIPTYLKDVAKARQLSADGSWRRIRGSSSEDGQLRAQFHFEELARRNYAGTPLEEL